MKDHPHRILCMWSILSIVPKSSVRRSLLESLLSRMGRLCGCMLSAASFDQDTYERRNCHTNQCIAGIYTLVRHHKRPCTLSKEPNQTTGIQNILRSHHWFHSLPCFHKNRNLYQPCIFSYRKTLQHIFGTDCFTCIVSFEPDILFRTTLSSLTTVPNSSISIARKASRTAL